jgi:hypothetical protein
MSFSILFEGDSWTVKKILSNTYPNQFFEMLPSRILAEIAADIQKVHGFDKVIQGLPQNSVSISVTPLTKSEDLENLVFS